MNHSHSEERTSAAFGELHRKIQKWIWLQGWDELHDIQEHAIHTVLQSEKDIVISAATARGKTEAVFLPICSKLYEEKAASIKALYIGPLKALINDQFARLEEICDELEIPVHRWHGDVSSSSKKKLMACPSGILLITPESLEALFVVHGPRIGETFKNLEYIVIDELHSFIGNERGRQLQMLLHRLEIVLGRRIRRFALSATMGDLKMAAEFLRKGGASEAELIESSESSQEIRLQIRGYIHSKSDHLDDKQMGDSEDNDGDYITIAEHLFRVLRGSDNLIFTNRRQDVEIYADVLRRLCSKDKLPNEFFPHHGNISKSLREDIEARLKNRSVPINVVCTSTLEMGIDIGSVNSIAQVGVPCSVASLRQRLGRSGRRGNPAVLRIYVQESELSEGSHIFDTLRPGLVQSIAMVELLIKKWFEPPLDDALHLSTLIQQLLSLIAQYGGISARNAWLCLCQTGPFRGVNRKMFSNLLHELGRKEILVQSSDGTLLLDLKGERIVNHYSFYAAFSTPEEYRLFTQGALLGTIPIIYPIPEGSYLIFSGRRWIVNSVDEGKKVVDLKPSKGGRAPVFEGTSGCRVHDFVRAEMRKLYSSLNTPSYLNKTGQELLQEAREYFLIYTLLDKDIMQDGKETYLFIWKGDRIINTFAVLLRSKGLRITRNGFLLTVHDSSVIDVLGVLREISDEDTVNTIIKCNPSLAKMVEKYDYLLNDELLRTNYMSSYLDIMNTISEIKRITNSNSF